MDKGNLTARARANWWNAANRSRYNTPTSCYYNLLLIYTTGRGKSCVWLKKANQKVCCSQDMFPLKPCRPGAVSGRPIALFSNDCTCFVCLKEMITRKDPFENKRCLKTVSSDKSNLYTKHFGAVYSATVSQCRVLLLVWSFNQVLRETNSHLLCSLNFARVDCTVQNWVLLSAAHYGYLWQNRESKRQIIVAA